MVISRRYWFRAYAIVGRSTIRCYFAQCGALSLLAASASAADTTAATSSANEDDLAEIVVTGSLIVDPNNRSASPIVITTAADLQQTGACDSSNRHSISCRCSRPTGTPPTAARETGGHATLDLHGLGSNRNLVLLDGRRLPPADITGAVDINLIPDSILSGVQTITGGASAVYGSEAISGVVNFITMKDFEGVAADAQYGNSFARRPWTDGGFSGVRQQIRRR